MLSAQLDGGFALAAPDPTESVDESHFRRYIDELVRQCQTGPRKLSAMIRLQCINARFFQLQLHLGSRYLRLAIPELGELYTAHLLWAHRQFMRVTLLRGILFMLASALLIIQANSTRTTQLVSLLGFCILQFFVFASFYLPIGIRGRAAGYLLDALRAVRPERVQKNSNLSELEVDRISRRAARARKELERAAWYYSGDIAQLAGRRRVDRIDPRFSRIARALTIGSQQPIEWQYRELVIVAATAGFQELRLWPLSQASIALLDLPDIQINRPGLLLPRPALPFVTGILVPFIVLALDKGFDVVVLR